jgi:hypothetical protein
MLPGLLVERFADAPAAPIGVRSDHECSARGPEMVAATTASCAQSAAFWLLAIG